MNSTQHDYFLLQTGVWRVNESVRYAYVPHLANVVLVHLFRVAVLTLRVWLGTVRVRVRIEYALNERRKNMGERIFERGNCFASGVLWVVLQQALPDRGARCSETRTPARVTNIIVAFSYACYLRLVPIRFELDEQLGEVVVYFHRISVLRVIYCLSTGRGKLQHRSLNTPSYRWVRTS
jgi:hypothetical protein